MWRKYIFRQSQSIEISESLFKPTMYLLKWLNQFPLKSGIHNSYLRKPKFSLEEIREILTWMRPCEKKLKRTIFWLMLQWKVGRTLCDIQWASSIFDTLWKQINEKYFRQVPILWNDVDQIFFIMHILIVHLWFHLLLLLSV